MTNTPVAELHDSLAKERADWLLDAIACATQDRRFLLGEPEYDEVAGEAILLNGEKAIQAAMDSVLNAASEYMKKVYGIAALSHPVDRERIFRALSGEKS